MDSLLYNSIIIIIPDCLIEALPGITREVYSDLFRNKAIYIHSLDKAHSLYTSTLYARWSKQRRKKQEEMITFFFPRVCSLRESYPPLGIF